jgi:hypothetical protein
MASHQIGRSQVIMTSNRVQRTLQTCCHVRDETRFTASGGTLEQHRQLMPVGMFKELHFLSLR